VTSVFEMNKTTISGRRFTRRQLENVRQTVEMFPNLSRNELAKTLCEHLCWKTPRGTNKVSSCIKLLTELERQGIVTLPEKDPVKAEAGKKSSGKIEHASEENAIEGELSSLKPIVLKAVETKEEHARLKSYLQTYHYLGYRKPIGSHLSYFVKSEATGQLLGCMQFSATAKPLLAPRDEWIGWEEKQKKSYFIWC
jgi:hypothetical protein